MPAKSNSPRQPGQQIRERAAQKANDADYKAIMKNVEKIRLLLDATVEMTRDTTVDVRMKVRVEDFPQISRIFDKGHLLYNMMIEPGVTYHRPPTEEELQRDSNEN